MMIFRVVFTGLLFLLPFGCAPQEPRISIEGPYAELSGMFIGAGSVFLTVRNEGGRDALLSATADLPDAKVELHDVRNNRMVAADRVAVPGKGSVELRPGGLHIMIFNMPKTVREGSEITLNLLFERSGQKKVAVRFGHARSMRSSPVTRA